MTEGAIHERLRISLPAVTRLPAEEPEFSPQVVTSDMIISSSDGPKWKRQDCAAAQLILGTFCLCNYTRALLPTSNRVVSLVDN